MGLTAGRFQAYDTGQNPENDPGSLNDTPRAGPSSSGHTAPQQARQSGTRLQWTPGEPAERHLKVSRKGIASKLEDRHMDGRGSLFHACRYPHDKS